MAFIIVAATKLGRVDDSICTTQNLIRAMTVRERRFAIAIRYSLTVVSRNSTLLALIGPTPEITCKPVKESIHPT